MIRLIFWILSLCVAVGVADAFVRLTLDMAKSAVHAHQHDQLKYSDFTRAMLDAKPRRSKHEQSEENK